MQQQHESSSSINSTKLNSLRIPSTERQQQQQQIPLSRAFQLIINTALINLYRFVITKNKNYYFSPGSSPTSRTAVREREGVGETFLI
jgi:predicted RNA-binding protein